MKLWQCRHIQEMREHENCNTTTMHACIHGKGSMNTSDAITKDEKKNGEQVNEDPNTLGSNTFSCEEEEDENEERADFLFNPACQKHLNSYNLMPGNF